MTTSQILMGACIGLVLLLTYLKLTRIIKRQSPNELPGEEPMRTADVEPYLATSSEPEMTGRLFQPQNPIYQLTRSIKVFMHGATEPLEYTALAKFDTWKDASDGDPVVYNDHEIWFITADDLVYNFPRTSIAYYVLGEVIWKDLRLVQELTEEKTTT